MLRVSDDHNNRLQTSTGLAALAWTIGGWRLKSQVLDAIQKDEFPRPTGASHLDGRPMWTTGDFLHYMRDHGATRYMLDAIKCLSSKQEATCTAA